MGEKPGRAVILPKDKKVQVLWTSFFFKTYAGYFTSIGGGAPPKSAKVLWERNTDLPPWHTWGEFNVWTRNDRNEDVPAEFLATVAGAYCNFWFTASQDMKVEWR